MGRFQNNQSTGWVHPKSTHARPLAWGNKNLNMFSFGFTWDLNNLSTHPPKQKKLGLDAKKHSWPPSPPHQTPLPKLYPEVQRKHGNVMVGIIIYHAI
jgi:hypothetical protein